MAAPRYISAFVLLAVQACAVAHYAAQQLTCQTDEDGCADEIDDSQAAAVELMQRQMQVNSQPQRRSSSDADPMPSKVAFIKTHATGSSTMLAILFRYCELHGRTCAQFPPSIAGKATSLNRIQLAGCAETQAGRVDVWPYHADFEADLFEEMMPGALKVSLFREPVSRIKSSFQHSSDPATIDELLRKLEDNDETMPGCGTAGIRMAAQVPISSFPKLDFVMLTEHYDLSLVMLGKRLGWSLPDLLYLRLKDDSKNLVEETTSGFSRLQAFISQPLESMTEAGRAFLSGCAGGPEIELYEMAKAAFEQQRRNLTTEEQAEVENDVSRLLSGLTALEECCRVHVEDRYCTLMRDDQDQWIARRDRNERVPPFTFEAPCRQEAIKAMLSI